MIVVMQPGHSRAERDAVAQHIEEAGLRTNIMEGVERTVIGVIGDSHTKELLRESLEALPGVESVVRILQPYKLVHREFHGGKDSVVWVRDVAIGGGRVIVMAGPCTVETRQQTLQTARAVKAAGAQILRGGAFKPRTSPYSFQGLGEEGLKLLREAGDKFGMLVVSEVMEISQIQLMLPYVDVLQVGARNMQNFNLLRELGKARKPVLLKRGIAATIEELLLSGEYLMAGGNYDVMLCERGIRTYETYTRNTLDISAIPIVHKLSHLPMVCDPSHGTGRREKVAPMARASVAAGADAVLVEVHNDPEKALSDGAQSLYPHQFDELMRQLRMIAAAVGRKMA